MGLENTTVIFSGCSKCGNHLALVERELEPTVIKGSLISKISTTIVPRTKKKIWKCINDRCGYEVC